MSYRAEADARFLKERGFTVFRQSDGSYLIDSRPHTEGELGAKADRERRLSTVVVLPVVTPVETMDEPAPKSWEEAWQAKVLPKLKARADELPPLLCEDCGGPRSLGSARVCRGCYTSKRTRRALAGRLPEDEQGLKDDEMESVLDAIADVQRAFERLKFAIMLLKKNKGL